MAPAHAGAFIGARPARRTPRPLTSGERLVTASLLLRIASVISLLFTAGHAMGGFKKWSPMGANDVLSVMESVHFDVMGAQRSYFDFFMGFGWSLSVAMLMQTVLLWQLASLARAGVADVRPMLGVIAAAMLANAVIAWQLIFIVPAVFFVVLFVLL